MCHTFVIISSSGEKKWADCCQQLADNLGCTVAELPMNEPRDQLLNPEEGLCWIDLNKIAADHAMAVTPPSYAANDPHWDDWILRADTGGAS